MRLVIVQLINNSAQLIWKKFQWTHSCTLFLHFIGFKNCIFVNFCSVGATSAWCGHIFNPGSVFNPGPIFNLGPITNRGPIFTFHWIRCDRSYWSICACALKKYRRNCFRLCLLFLYQIAYQFCFLQQSELNKRHYPNSVALVNDDVRCVV